MGNLLRLVGHTAALKWTVAQALLDYRRLSSRTELTLLERAEWMHRWSVRMLDRLDVECEVHGPTPGAGVVVSNHLSYMDIAVIGSHMPCVFVSKAEVKNWPVFGTLTDIGGTVYVDRARRSDTRNANDSIRTALQQGVRIVIFPEGTSTDGSKVLPFYPSLLEPATEAGVPITAAHISYQVEQGSVGTDVAYWGDMTFFPHLLRLLSTKNVSAKLHFAAAARTFTNRKTAAVEMREEVLRLM
jgi:1-acyl-sn-glycerol-3-phosphate acyltransferase